MNLISRYIQQGRFGKFVSEFLNIEHERKKAEAEKDDEWKLWVAYIHSYSGKSFSDWKNEVLKPAGEKTGGDENLTADGIQSIIDGLFHKKTE